MRIIRRLFGTPVCEICRKGVVIVKESGCGEPDCHNTALIAFLFGDGVIYSCVDHFMEIVSRLKIVGDIN